MPNFEVNTVPADGLAPLDSMPSAGRELTKLMPRFYTEPVHEALKPIHILKVSEKFWWVVISIFFE